MTVNNKSDEDKNKSTLYKIYITISNIPLAGTNQNVYLQLFGKKKLAQSSEDRNNYEIISFKFPLEKSINNKKKFQPGQTDLFEIEEIYVGKLEKIRIGHDGKTINSGFHLDKIIIEVPDFNKSWKFKCGKWLDPFKGDGKTERELLPLKSKDEHYFSDDENKKEDENELRPSGKVNKIRYDMKIKTSEFSNADLDLKVDLKIIGVLGETDYVKLNSTPSDNEKDKFVKGNIDIFKFEEKDVGKIEKILIMCNLNERDKITEWFFDEIVIDTDAVSVKKRRYFFNKNSRQVIIKEKEHSVFEIYPNSQKKMLNRKIYTINLYTNKLTDKEYIVDNVWVTIYGDFGNSGELKPHFHGHNSISHNKTDLNDDLIHFHFNKIDLGEIYKIKVRHTQPPPINVPNSKPQIVKTNWFLKEIEVNYYESNFNFPYKKWIKTDHEKKKVEIKLFEQKKKCQRTISTLSHRLLSESIDNDDYDDSFDDSDRSRSNSSRSTKRSGSSFGDNKKVEKLKLNLDDSDGMDSYRKDYKKDQSKNRYDSPEDYRSNKKGGHYRDESPIDFRKDNKNENFRRDPSPDDYKYRKTSFREHDDFDRKQKSRFDSPEDFTYSKKSSGRAEPIEDFSYSKKSSGRAEPIEEYNYRDPKAKAKNRSPSPEEFSYSKKSSGRAEPVKEFNYKDPKSKETKKRIESPEDYLYKDPKHKEERKTWGRPESPEDYFYKDQKNNKKTNLRPDSPELYNKSKSSDYSRKIDNYDSKGAKNQDDFRYSGRQSPEIFNEKKSLGYKTEIYDKNEKSALKRVDSPFEDYSRTKKTDSARMNSSELTGYSAKNKDPFKSDKYGLDMPKERSLKPKNLDFDYEFDSSRSLSARSTPRTSLSPTPSRNRLPSREDPYTSTSLTGKDPFKKKTGLTMNEFDEMPIKSSATKKYFDDDFLSASKKTKDLSMSSPSKFDGLSRESSLKSRPPFENKFQMEDRGFKSFKDDFSKPKMNSIPEKDDPLERPIRPKTNPYKFF